MKKVFIYYSYTGNGDIVSKKYMDNGYDVYKVTTKKRPIPNSFFFGMLIGGMLSGMNHKSKINEIDINLDEYDKIIIGSPIWNSKLACPTNAMLSQIEQKFNNKLANKDVSFVLYSGSGEGRGANKKIKELYPNAKITFLKEPKKYSENLDKLEL